LRRRRRGQLGDPPRPQRDGHSADTTDPDQHIDANADPNPDLGRASDLADDPTRDLG
jgi:hypothetical protein